MQEMHLGEAGTVGNINKGSLLILLHGDKTKFFLAPITFNIFSRLESAIELLEN